MKTISKAIMLLLFQSIFAQQKPIEITKISEPINFDGIVNEAFWNTASAFPLIRQSPDYGSIPSEKTNIRMVYDNTYLYVATSLYQNDTSKIQDFAKQRDAGGPNDYMAFAFDGYNDKTNGQAFATTPAGLRWDAAITFGANGVGINSNWNTYWEVKTSRNDSGWYAEFKIPLSSLRFKSDKTEVLMNFIAWRKITSVNELDVFPDAKPDYGVLSFANIANGYPILFKGIKNSNPVYITPYALGSFNGNKVLNATNTAYKSTSESNFEAGVDVKYSLSSELTLDATINTDFAQAEADNFQVNLSRSSLFFPEKREFFLERTGNFSFGFDNNNDVFYSRRIGLDNGVLSRIYGGARVVGRIKKWDIGFLNMQTEDLNTTGSKNIGLLRFKKQVGENNSYYGGIFTSSIGKNNNQFYTYGLDTQWSLPFKSFLKLAAAKSVEKGNQNVTSKDNLRFNARLEMPSQVGFYSYLSYSMVGTNYNPVLGFEERENIKSYDAGIGYALFYKKVANLFKSTAKISAYKIDGFESNKEESSGIAFYYNVELKNGALTSIKNYYLKEVLLSPLILSEAVSIPIGSYDFNGFLATINTPTGESIYGSCTLDIGSFYNGNKLSLGLFGRFDGSKLLQFQLDYKYDRIYFGSQKPQFENHLLSLTSVLNFNTKVSISALAQYDYLNSKVGTNIRLRYNAKEGNDLFIVLTNIENTDRYRLIPTLPSIQSWLFVAKYKHTFAF
jgi:hypothetical protein